MFVDHDGKFVKDGSEFHNVGFDLFHGIGTLLKIILVGNELHQLILPRLLFHALNVIRGKWRRILSAIVAR